MSIWCFIAAQIKNTKLHPLLNFNSFQNSSVHTAANWWADVSSHPLIDVELNNSYMLIFTAPFIPPFLRSSLEHRFEVLTFLSEISMKGLNSTWALLGKAVDYPLHCVVFFFV